MRSLFINGKIWQPSGLFDEAIGTDNGHIIFVGSQKEANEIVKQYDRIVDFGGRLVLPALTDSHLHLCYGSMMKKRLDCREIKSLPELKNIIEKYSDNNANAKWIVGSNLNIPVVFAGKNLESENFTDEIFSAKPMFIGNYDYHSALCNTAALSSPSVKPQLSKFGAGEIPRDKNGKPTGLVKEEALDLIFENLPQPTTEENSSAVKDFIRQLHSYGITTVTDITLPENLEIYNHLFKTGELDLRINSYIPFEEFPNLKAHEQSTREISRDYFSICGFKAFYDGALGSATALFSENYKGTNQNGYKTEQASSGELKKLALEIDKAGLQLIIHAIGDLAVTEVLDLAEELAKVNGARERRLRIEHAQHINEKDFERFKSAGVIISAQPMHLRYDAKLVKQVLPESLIPTTHNYKLLIERGVKIVFGTDFPIVEVNPFENIQMAMTRKTEDGEFTPEFKIPLHECIKTYTINAAYSNFNENAAGTIEKGKVADFVVMEDDLFKIEPEKIGKARVRKTFLNGEEVYSLEN